MSSRVFRPYFGPADFRMLREILGRAGYILSDSPITRSAHLKAGQRLIAEFLATRRDPLKMLDMLQRRNPHETTGSEAQVERWENEGGAVRPQSYKSLPVIVRLGDRKGKARR